MKKRGTKKLTATVHVSFTSPLDLVFSFCLFNNLIYRIVEYVQLRLMFCVTKPSTETNPWEGGGGWSGVGRVMRECVLEGPCVRVCVLRMDM